MNFRVLQPPFPCSGQMPEYARLYCACGKKALEDIDHATVVCSSHLTRHLSRKARRRADHHHLWYVCMYGCMYGCMDGCVCMYGCVRMYVCIDV